MRSVNAWKARAGGARATGTGTTLAGCLSRDSSVSPSYPDDGTCKYVKSKLVFEVEFDLLLMKIDNVLTRFRIPIKIVYPSAYPR